MEKTNYQRRKLHRPIKLSPGFDPSARIKGRFPEFEKGWEKLVREMGTDFIDFLKEKIKAEYSFLEDLKNFKLKLVVDNNFVLGQIKGAVKKKESIEKSFIYKLLESSSVEIYAPFLLHEELRTKIAKVLEPQDQEMALQYAATLLSKIKVQDAQWTDNWKKANAYIGNKDPDDVPYLALALEIGSHAIVSFDNVFFNQGDVKVWKHKETDQVIANYHSGCISFFIMGNVVDLLAKLVAVIYRILRDAIIQLVELLIKLAKGVVVGISKIPPAILFLLVGLGIIFYDEIRTAGKDFVKFLVERGKEIISKLKKAIAEILDIIKLVLETAKLGGIIALEFLGFLLAEYIELNAQLDDLKFDGETIDR